MKNKVNTVFLIDGQNNHHALESLGIKVSQIDHAKMFSELAGGEDNWSALWFRPRSIQDLHLNKWMVLEHLIQKRCPRELEKVRVAFKNNTLSTAMERDIHDTYAQSQQWLAQNKAYFRKVEKFYLGLEQCDPRFELVREGELKVDSLKKEKLGEKGVDVALALEMVEVARRQEVQKIFLFSGDSDLVPAVQKVQRMGKEVVVVSYKSPKGKSKTLSGSLKEQANRSRTFNLNELKEKYVRKTLLGDFPARSQVYNAQVA